MTNDFFTKYDVRGEAESGATLEIAWNTGKALADWLPTSGDVVVVRAEGANEQMVHGLVEGLTLQGRDVVDGGHGDKASLQRLIMTGYSGGALAGFDTISKVATLELYKEDGSLIDGATGLQELEQLVEAGNFVPAATKGAVRSV